MLSSVPSYDEELLNSAYTNIALIADKAWAFHRDDPFRKLNHTLWVQNCKLTAKYRENGNYQPRCVRDTIPGSRLAHYGNYEYSEERERMYKPADNTPVAQQSDICNDDTTEPWMLKEVEEHFARLSSGATLRLNNELSPQLQSSTTEGLEIPGKVLNCKTGRTALSKWDNVLKKRYPNLEQTLPPTNSSGKHPTSSSLCTTHTDETYYKNVDPEDYDRYLPPRYTIDNVAEMQLQTRVTSDTIRDLWNSLKSPQQQQRFQYSQRHQQNLQCGQQQPHRLPYNKQPHLQCGFQHQSVPVRPGRYPSSSQSIGIVRQSPPPMLSADVPEFFPKGPMSRLKDHQKQSVPLQFFPSSTERSYQEELFPYNTGRIPGSGNVLQNVGIPIQQVSNATSITRPSHQWIQRPSPALHIQVPVCPSPCQPVCTPLQPVCPAIIQRRIQVQDKFAGNVTPQGVGPTSTPIPVYQKPPELYNDPSQRRKNQGVDFNNLILLTKSAMKARRNQSKNSQQRSSFILESRQPNLKSEIDVLQWLEKGYPKRAKEFVAVNTLVSDFRSFELKCNDTGIVLLNQNSEEEKSDPNDVPLPDLDKSLAKSSEVETSSDMPTKRRLYRDVLTNSSSPGIITENIFDRRYDELERQAMEQYRTSEECLALRYQELERQAMEQYRNCDSGTGNTSNSQIQNPSSSPSVKSQQQDQNKSVIEDKECIGGHKCSGFGHCSPIKIAPSLKKKGTQPHQPITILRPESRLGISACLHRGDFHHKCSRPAVVTKSLTALNQRLYQDSKNTTRGASGDKIDGTVRASPKRRLILMSPSKLESDAVITRTPGLEGTYTIQSMNRRITGSYQKSEVIQTGGGDEKVNILRSPRMEGIRKQLFLSNEGLMDSSSESLAIRLLESTEGGGPCMKTEFLTSSNEKIVSVSSETSVAPVVVTEKEAQQNRFLSTIGCSLWKEGIAHQKISTHATRNKKTQCKPHNIVTIEKTQLRYTNTLLMKPITLPLEASDADIELVDIISHENLTRTEVQNVLSEFHLKSKTNNGDRKMCQLTYFVPTTFKNENYLRVTNSFPYYCSSTLDDISLCTSYGNGRVEDAKKIIIHADPHLYPANLFQTAQINLINKVWSENILTVRWYKVQPTKSYNLRLLSPFQLLPLWNNYKMNSLHRLALEQHQCLEGPRRVASCQSLYPILRYNVNARVCLESSR